MSHPTVILHIALLGMLWLPETGNAQARGPLKIVTAAGALAEIQNAASAIAAAASEHPLLKILAAGRPIERIDSDRLLAAEPEDRAFSHLVLVGLMSDPMIQRAWQREARPVDGGIYLFGFGFLKGDLGYIESDRNPFLHGRDIKSAPFETEVVTITGTTPAGVVAAARAFLKHDVINGVVAGGRWSRGEAGLLDRDPLAAEFSPPAILPAQVADFPRIGLTQASEDEYRGVLADTGVEPAEIWRAKYYVAGAWDGKGAETALLAYHTGLHRRATGNSLWAARFASPEEAAAALPKIATAAGLHRKGKTGYIFAGNQPPVDSTKGSPGSLVLWRSDNWLLMSTLPEQANPPLPGRPD